MKRLLIGLLALSSMSAFAHEIEISSPTQMLIAFRHLAGNDVNSSPQWSCIDKILLLPSEISVGYKIEKLVCSFTEAENSEVRVKTIVNGKVHKEAICKTGVINLARAPFFTGLAD